MQDRYIGDLGDFGKYGLLRALCPSANAVAGADLSLGMVWYLFPDEGNNNDGRYVQYLDPTASNEEQFRSCDPTVYDALAEIVGSGRRKVSSIRESGILPIGTLYYEARLTFDELPSLDRGGQRLRTEFRTSWLKGAFESTAPCDLVFMDPDNGFEVNVAPHHKRGPKYTFFNELLPFSKRKQSLVVYHHISRRGTSFAQIQKRLAQIEAKLGHESFALLYHRGSARAFFVIPADRHKELLRARANRFLEGRWARHIELVTPA